MTAVEQVAPTSSAALKAAAIADVLGSVGHPMRLRLLMLYAEHEKLSPVDAVPSLAEGTTLGTVSYHVRRMSEDGLIRKAGRKQIRGAIKHFYSLTPKGRRIVDALTKLAA